jgi:hypothetical protein
MTSDGFTLFMTAIYPVLIVCGIIFLSWTSIQRRRNLVKLMENVSKKLAANVSLSAKDIIHIGRGFHLSPKSSGEAIYKLYTEANDPNSYAALKALISNLEKEEAFDDLPDEVKPSMMRIAKLIDHSGDPADKHILLPITTTLNKYVELKVEQEKAKKQTYRAYIITIISFMVGASSFYFTLKSPSADDIKKTVEQVLIEKSAGGSVGK